MRRKSREVKLLAGVNTDMQLTVYHSLLRTAKYCQNVSGTKTVRGKRSAFAVRHVD